MRSQGRRWSVLLVVVALLAACSADGDVDDGRRIAFLRALPGSDQTGQDAFLDELEDRGYTTGENLTVWAGDLEEAHPEPGDARRAVERWTADGVDVIVALSTVSASAADEAGGDTPVVFLVNDPVAAGLVADERTPEGHLTGTTFRVPADRTLALAIDALGDLQRIGCLYPRDDPAAQPALADIRRGGEALGIAVDAKAFASDGEVAGAVDAVIAGGAEAILLANSPSTVRAFPAIEAALAGHEVPVVANTAADFALLVLQPDISELYRQLARQTARLLDGEAVADTPVEDPGRFEVVVNLRVAADLGIDVPDSVVSAADVVVRD